MINYFFFVAEEVRELMAELGFRTFDEMIGQMQMLDQRRLVEHWKAKGLDFSKLFLKPEADTGTAIYKCEEQDHKIHDILDRKLIAEAQAGARPRRAGAARRPRSATPTAPPAPCCPARSPSATAMRACRTAPSMCASPAPPARASAPGSRSGVTFELEGDANDYVGKGLSGGRIIIRPPADSRHRAGGIDHRRQHRAVRRHRAASAISAASPASASPCAIPAPSR